MADEFQTSGNWWDSSRASRFEAAAAAGTASPSSSALNSLGNIGPFGWSSAAAVAENDHSNSVMVDIKSRASMDSASVSGSSPMVFHDGQKLQASDNSAAAADANLHMMGLGLSNSQTMDWNHALFRGEKAAPEGSFRAILQDGMAGPNPAGFQQQDQIQWREKIFHGHHHHDHSSTATNSRGFSLDQQSQFSPQYSSGDSTVTCQGLASGFQVDSAALYGSPSAILQGLFGPDGATQQQVQSYNSAANFGLNSNDLLASSNWSTGNTNNSNKLPQFLRNTNSPPKPSPPPPPPPPYSSTNSHLHFSNNAPFWNAPEAAMKDARSATGFFPALQPQFPTATFDEKPKNISEVRDSGSVAKKSGNEAASNKRPRNDQTPSTLPAFKVRKEKMGDRITALQQLVSPFGKTDTASVLSEAIEYIKFLHEQVTVLSTPYMKSGAAIQHHQNSEKSKDPEDPKQDLRSRGLCLVPVSSTFPVTHETTVDFWTPTFGGTFR